jgi:uncharacterized membrane protein YagU involved in acid resistance
MGRGIIAGFIATVVLTVLMLVKEMIGLMPELNVISMLSTMANAKMGMPATPMVGYLLHFVIGAIVFGVLFHVLNGSLPGGNQLMKGIVFGVVAWLLMMLLVMPMAGAGMFGMSMGTMAPVMTLLLHVIFGAVLGFSYSKLA